MRILNQFLETPTWSIKSLLGLDRKAWFIQDLTAAIVGAWLYKALELFGVYVIDPYYYFVIVLLIGCDFVTGVWLAARRKQFQTSKALRGFGTIVAYTALIFFATSLARAEPKILSWLPTAVVTPMVLILLISFVKNLALLGFVKMAFLKALLKSIDQHKEGVSEALNDESTPEEAESQSPK